MDPHQDKNSFDSIIDQHFPKDIQQKRIKKELVSLNELDAEYFKVSLQNTAIGLKVIVELSNELIEMELENTQNIKLPAVFELLLDSQFPFNLPRLFTRTPIYEPSLADARDYLEDVMQRPWSPTILLKEVITQIPKFLKRVNELPKWEDSQSIGKYHPGELYSLEDLIGLESVNLFTGEEVLQTDGHTSPRYLGIVESSFLKFEPTEKTRNIVKLLLWTPIRSIVNIKKGNGDDRTLILTFIDKEKKSGFGQNKFLMTENRKFLKLIMDMGLKYNVGISRALRDTVDLSQYIAKQTPRNRREKIEELLQAITVFETKMETELNKDLIYGLMGLYQKVVEHFATHEDPMFEDFVGRLRNLMERQDIQAALRNEQQSPVHANKPSHGTDENQEEEEEKQGQPRKPDQDEQEEEEFEGYQQREQEFIGGQDVPREEERVKAHHVDQPQDEEEKEYEQYQQKQEEVLGDEVENREEEEEKPHAVEEREVEARDEEEREYEQYQQKQEEFVGGQVENREEEEAVKGPEIREEQGGEVKDEEERAYEEYQRKVSEELEQKGEEEQREEDENMFKAGENEENEERREENEVINEPEHEEKQEEQEGQRENNEVEERQEEVKEEENQIESKEERAETEENMFKLEENNEQKEEQDQQKSQEEIVEEANNEENNGEQQGEEHVNKEEEDHGEPKSEEEEGTHTVQEGGI